MDQELRQVVESIAYAYLKTESAELSLKRAKELVSVRDALAVLTRALDSVLDHAIEDELIEDELIDF